jgi:flagellar biosynthesis GTPase FlhF
MDKNALEQLLSSYNWWMGVSTVAVAVGILGEYVAHFVFEKEARRNRLEMGISIFFGVLVLGGVVGEYVFGKKLSQLSEQIQQVADKQVAQANLDAAQARRDAEVVKHQSADTNERAANAEQQAAQENARAAKALQAAEVARKNAEAFQLEIAQANERAARAEKDASQANQQAEQERLARVKIEQQLAPRVLTQKQQEKIQAKLRGFVGTPYELAVDPVPEAIGLLTAVDNILRSSGWFNKESEKKDFRFNFTLPNGSKVEQVYFSGFEIQAANNMLPKYRKAVETAVAAFQEEGMDVKMTFLPANDPSPNAIHIAIGTK